MGSNEVSDTLSTRVPLEIAVDDLEGAVAAAAAGADRLELCAALDLGGLTPSPGLLAAVKARVGVPVFAMIRPRAGDFVYTSGELDAMAQDIELARSFGADGLVLGVLTASGSVDAPAVRALVETARPLPVTFHRAFDAAADLTRALDALVDVGCARVLTAGGAPTAAAGVASLRALVVRAGSRLRMVAAGSVRIDTVEEVVAAGVHEVHAGPRRALAPATTAGRTTTDAEAVRGLAARLRARG
jgi:copper homeostasis protein